MSSQEIRKRIEEIKRECGEPVSPEIPFKDLVDMDKVEIGNVAVTEEVSEELEEGEARNRDASFY